MTVSGRSSAAYRKTVPTPTPAARATSSVEAAGTPFGEDPLDGGQHPRSVSLRVGAQRPGAGHRPLPATGVIGPSSPDGPARRRLQHVRGQIGLVSFRVDAIDRSSVTSSTPRRSFVSNKGARWKAMAAAAIVGAGTLAATPSAAFAGTAAQDATTAVAAVANPCVHDSNITTDPRGGHISVVVHMVCSIQLASIQAHLVITRNVTDVVIKQARGTAYNTDRLTLVSGSVPCIKGVEYTMWNSFHASGGYPDFAWSDTHVLCG
jgi:hypothetical protein